MKPDKDPIGSRAVHCQHCRGVIRVVAIKGTATEMSLPCPYCGRRKIYSPDTMFLASAAEPEPARESPRTTARKATHARPKFFSGLSRMFKGSA
jgi:hypothetical protein